MTDRIAVERASAWRPEDFDTDDVWSSSLTVEQAEALRRVAAGGGVERLEEAFEEPAHHWRHALTDGQGFLPARFSN